MQQLSDYAGLPALACLGAVNGGLLGGLIVFASIISMLEIRFAIEKNSQKRSKK
jgi:hypothetical protein